MEPEFLKWEGSWSQQKENKNDFQNCQINVFTMTESGIKKTCCSEREDVMHSETKTTSSCLLNFKIKQACYSNSIYLICIQWTVWSAFDKNCRWSQISEYRMFICLVSLEFLQLGSIRILTPLVGLISGQMPFVFVLAIVSNCLLLLISHNYLLNFSVT